ncbi:hypothetical protein JRI60_00435 [Archangium violaceum]|uniref:hypothetical protein n=1 Tax=Archangium violaceum TaxID=83451 RepID=UPI00194F8CBF|nr:hypothetical protein [Archangium violaceum]QRN97598.1 hypothetical protein JRI60_00435 [Archangium violaceum]
MTRVSGSNTPRIQSTQPARQQPEPVQTAQAEATPQRVQLHSRDTFETGNPGLDAINAAQLLPGRDHTCVTTVRANLQRAGLQGLPSTTSQDGNNPRGMMVQMLQSGHWHSAAIPGATQRAITSPYGTVQAQVLSGDAYMAAARDGQIPEGSVVFQTRHPAGWAYGGGSRGSDVGIVRDGGIFNYRQFSGMSVYGNNLSEVVVLQPGAR